MRSEQNVESNREGMIEYIERNAAQPLVTDYYTKETRVRNMVIIHSSINLLCWER